MRGDDDALEGWSRATGLQLPRPPVPASDWTCALDVLGPFRVLARHDDLPLLDATTLRGWLEALGRPTHAAESRALLLVTPVPRVPDPEGVLVRLLGHPHPSLRAGAARLTGSGSHPKAVAGLQQVLRGPTEAERRAALWGLGRLGGPAVVSALVDGADLVGERLASVAAVAARHGWDALPLDGDGAVVSWLRAVRGDNGRRLAQGLGDDALRDGLAACVAARPTLAAELVETLVDALQEGPALDRVWALTRALGRGGEEAVEPLAELLRHGAGGVRVAAAMALAAAGPAAAQVDGALREALSDDDADVQREAALARQVAGRDPSGMTARLARRVVRSHGFVERVQELGASLGPFDAVLYGRDPTPELLARLSAPHDLDVAAVAALWVGRRGPWGGASLDAMAVDRHQRVPLPLRRAAAAGRLAGGGVPVEGGVLARLLLAHDPGHPGPGLDGSGLGAHGGELAALALGDPDATVRWAAVQALRGLGEEVAPFLDVLDRVAATDPVAEVRSEARWARPPRFRSSEVSAQLAEVLHPGPGTVAAGGPALWALSVDDPALAFSVACGLLDHDLRPLAVAAARVVGRGAAKDPARGVLWTHEGLRRLADDRWASREVGAVLLGAMDGGPEGLREEALEALVEVAASDPDDDVQAAAASAVAAWRRVWA